MLKDVAGRVIFHGSDTIEFILIAFPEADRAALIQTLLESGIPEDVP